MTQRTLSIDLFGPFFIVYCILLIVGTIPLTGASVGAGLLISQIHLPITWTWRSR